MLKKLWTFSLSVIAILLIVLISCSKQDPENPQEPSFTTVEVKGVSLNKTSADMQVGESMVLVATVLPSNASDKSVIWSSSNSDVVTVTNGSVTALSVGSATVTVITNSGGKTASCKINVKGDVAVESVTLSQESTQIAEGDTLRLTATVSPNNATNPSLEWTSTNATVATVNDGLVTALKAGDTQVIVKAVDGGKSDTCSVTVIANENFVHVTGISFSIPTSVIAVGESIALQAVIEPENATNKNVAWSSSNTGVATVDQKGTLTGIACGETKVSLTAEDGGLTASAVFTVSDKVPVTSITIENVPSLLPVGYMTCLTVAVQPENASDKSVIWTSSRPSVATVNDLGYVSGIAPGETVITAAAVGGNVRATCNIRVGIPVESIEFGGIPEQMFTGNTYNIEARIYPENATNKTLVWTSSNPSVATVDNGAVTAIAPGEAEITVTADDGLMSESFRITVVETVYVTGVTIDWTPGVMRVGDRQWLNANVQPENATNRNVTWSTSNPFAVTVSEHGEVYAVAEGDAEITVTTDDGGKKATCKISVGIPVDWVEITNYKTDFVTGDVYTYNVNIHPEDATNKTLVWTSSNPSVASIDNGTITAISPGETEITVAANNGMHRMSFFVNVIGRVPVTSVTIENAPNFLRIGEMTYLWANVQPENATNKNVTWSTSNPLVATVNEDGSVYGISAGEVEITATSVDGGIKGSCKITVGIPVDWVDITNFKTDFVTGDVYTYNVNIHPEDATNKTLVWTSSNPSVASIDNGTITAISPGETEIIVTANNGIRITSFNVNVIGRIPVTSVTIENAPNFLRIGEMTYLWANVQPENATNKNVTWSTSNPLVATVNEDGSVYGISAGEVEITATSVDGGIKGSCKITVGIPVEWLDFTNYRTEFVAGDVYTYHVNVNPENATDKTLVWTSSNPSVASIDNGTITAISPGETEIIVTANNGIRIISFNVNVIGRVPVTSVTIENAPNYVRIGDMAYLWANVQPENATNKNVTWSTSNPLVATVNEDGSVYGISAGEVEITATSVDGGIKGTCKISVRIPVDWVDVTNHRSEFFVGETYTYETKIYPENATDKTLVWNSSNPNVATVNNGVVRAISEGETEISYSANNGTTGNGWMISVRRYVPVTSVTIENVPGIIRVGEWAYLNANVQPEDAINKDVVWSSSNPSVATVNEGGDVYAVSVGETEITATAADNGIKSTRKITVGVPVESVDFTNFRNEFVVGEVFTYNVNVYPENATNKNLIWTSSNTSVVTVENGVLRAIAPGGAYVNIVPEDGCMGGYSHYVTVYSEYNPNGISLDNSYLEIIAGEKAKLSATVHPEYATNKNVIWSTTDPNVATVDNNGTVTAVAHGYCYIVATTEVGGCSTECQIYVPQVPVTGVSLDKSSTEIFVEQSVKLVANIAPANATNKNLHWESSNWDVATVENGIVKGVNPGVAVINVYTSEGWFNAQCTVTVKPNLVTGISLSKTSVEMTQEDEFTLVATITPNNATNKNVIWSSSSPESASVVNGVVKAIRAGEVTITAKTEDGGYTATCKFYIKAKNGVDVGEWGEGENNEGEAQ